jgi:hypothetical protein
MGWQCEICKTTDQRKMVIFKPPRCWDCLGVVLESHPPVFQDLLDSVTLDQPRSDLPCLFKRTAPYAR